jgi:tripartite ATP-independent transporter DctM subunit
MQKYNYSPSLATGTIAAGGTLGIMIPPSVPLVIYGLVTQQDIGTLFMAGIIPGILLVVSFLLAVGIWTRLNPDAAPSDDGNIDIISTKKSVRAVIPILLLFVLVLGGIYGRVFTPTEASGIGAFGAAIVALSRGYLSSWSQWREVLVDTTISSASLFMVLFGATIFMQYITLSGMPFELMYWVDDMNLSPMGLVLMITFISLLMGMVFEAIGILLLIVPLFLPALEMAGVNMIWFAIIIVLVIELALITPPIGINVFVVNSMVKDIPIIKVFKGVLPFVLAMLVVLGLLLIWPNIVLFVPNLNPV